MFKNALLTLIVSDMERSITFYSEILGFQLVNRFGNEWAEMQASGLKIGLHPQGKWQKVSKAESMSIGLSVDNLDSAMAELKKRGVAFQHTINEESGRIALFSDPDGYKLYLHEQSKKK
jgi:predicted enzyme related to lactoylglutathione lyase